MALNLPFHLLALVAFAAGAAKAGLYPNAGYSKPGYNKPLQQQQQTAPSKPNVIIEDAQNQAVFAAVNPFTFGFTTNGSNPYGWLAVTVNVNGDVSVVNAKDNSTSYRQLSSLDEGQIAFIYQTRDYFAQNLAFPALEPVYYGYPNQKGYASRYMYDKQKSRYNSYRQGYDQFKGSFQAQSAGYQFGPYLGYQQQSVGYRQGPPLSYRGSSLGVQPANNYFNLASSPLNKTLLGDVYMFDAIGTYSVPAIFSTTVSMHCEGALGRTIVYRDANYFVWSRPKLPVNIFGFMLAYEFVFFLYWDGSLLIKPLTNLEQVELDVVNEGQFDVNELVSQWPYRGTPAISQPVMQKSQGQPTSDNSGGSTTTSQSDNSGNSGSSGNSSNSNNGGSDNNSGSSGGSGSSGSSSDDSNTSNNNNSGGSSNTSDDSNTSNNNNSGDTNDGSSDGSDDTDNFDNSDNNSNGSDNNSNGSDNTSGNSGGSSGGLNVGGLNVPIGGK